MAKLKRKQLVKRTAPEPTPQEEEARASDLISEWARTTNKLTPKLIKQICSLARKGDTATTICDLLGITSTLFHKWLKRGNMFRETGGPPEFEVYGAFVNLYRKAHAEFLQTLREKVVEGGKDYYNNMVILERRDRKNWGRNQAPGDEDNTGAVDERFV